MKHVDDSSDRRHKAWCIHCGGTLAGMAVTRDHVPTKSLLDEPYPAALPVVSICKPCNNGFSADEQYLSTFLECVIVGSTDPNEHDPRTAARLRRLPDLGAMIERSKTSFRTIGGSDEVAWTPDQGRINNVVLKNARGHALYEYGEPLLSKPASVIAIPAVALKDSERRVFEECGAGELAAWPEVGSRAMSRLISGHDMDGAWVVVQPGFYRYAVFTSGRRLFVRTVIREYLLTEVLWNDD